MSSKSAPTTLSPEGLKRLQRYEACSLVVYDDIAGRATIGWGHLIKPGEDFSKGLTAAQAEILLLADLKPRIEAVVSMLEVDVTQEQFDSCVSLLYNIGEEAFRSSSFLRAVNTRAPNDTIRVCLKKWNKATDPKTGQKVVSTGLVNRRADEAQAWPDP